MSRTAPTVSPGERAMARWCQASARVGIERDGVAEILDRVLIGRRLRFAQAAAHQQGHRGRAGCRARSARSCPPAGRRPARSAPSSSASSSLSSAARFSWPSSAAGRDAVGEAAGRSAEASPPHAAVDSGTPARRAGRRPSSPAARRCARPAARRRDNWVMQPILPAAIRSGLVAREVVQLARAQPRRRSPAAAGCRCRRSRSR